MRLFVAIDVPDSVKEHLSFLQRSSDLRGVRFVHPRNIHLTLNFLGERDDLESIISSLRTVTFSPFSLRLSGIGCFPHEDDPRVAWVGLERCAELSDLQRQVDLRFRPDKSFRPHLTIARLKGSSQERHGALRSLQRFPLKPLSFRVSSFRLYQSTLTSLGPVYEVVETFRSS